MKSVIALLNLFVEGKSIPSPLVIFPEEARLALHAIETQELAVSALRTLADNPQSHEALAHAKRFLHLHDSYPQIAANLTAKDAKRTAARQHAEDVEKAIIIEGLGLAAATSEEKQDVSDLV